MTDGLCSWESRLDGSKGKNPALVENVTSGSVAVIVNVHTTWMGQSKQSRYIAARRKGCGHMKLRHKRVIAVSS